MNLRDIVVVSLILSAVQSYALTLVAPHLNLRLSSLLTPFLSLNLSLYFIYRVVIYPFLLSPLRHLPGPRGGILGSQVAAAFSKPRGEAIRKWSEEIPNNGLLRFRKIFNKDALILTSNESLRACLNDHCYDYEKEPRVRDILKTVLGDGLILVEGGVHKFQRKHLLPSFHLKVIRDLYPTFWAKAVQLTNHLPTAADLSTEVEMGVWCTRVTLDIIGIAGFGRDFDCLVRPDDPFVRDYNELLEPTTEKALYFGLNLVFPHKLIDVLKPVWHIPRDLETISKNLYNFAYNLSRERRAELNSLKSKSTAVNKDSPQRNDILSLLVKSNDFTDHQLAHQVLTMMAAGHETTSSTLSWCLFLLATNPSYQTLLRDEVRANLPSPSASNQETVTAAQIDSLPYLNSTTLETLRLYPTVPITTRIVVKDTQLCGMNIPKGTSIFICPWAINRSERTWGSDALDFVPERWLDIKYEEKESGEKVKKVTLNASGGVESNYDVMTFLHGPRSCVGQGFARSELKCLLAALIGRYEFTITRDISTYYTAGLVTTKPANGMWLKITEVPGW